MTKTNVYMRAGALLLALMLALMLAACGSDDNGDTDAGAQPEETTVETGGTEEAPGEGGSQVVVTATEFEFDLPETLPAGETTFNFVNQGKQPHEMALVQLSEDAPPVEELLQLSEKKAEGFFTEAGHAFAKPGETQEEAFTTDLTSGTRYGYVCFVEDKKTKKPHAFLGMVGEFTVE